MKLTPKIKKQIEKYIADNINEDSFLYKEVDIIYEALEENTTLEGFYDYVLRRFEELEPCIYPEDANEALISVGFYELIATIKEYFKAHAMPFTLEYLDACKLVNLYYYITLSNDFISFFYELEKHLKKSRLR